MALLELAVRDLALIERARLRLRPGLTVITGETGAGKSLLIDALSLVLGGRSDQALVRAGTDLARVEALFDLTERDEPLICVREVTSAGRSVARVDDEAVTVARLAALAGPLVEIHGQHEQQRLLGSAWQRDLLDAYAEHAAEREAVARAVADWRANDAALAELAVEPAELARRMALAEHAVDEIESASPRAGEVESLRARLALAAGAERLVRVAAGVHETLVGEGPSAREAVVAAGRQLQELTRTDDRLAVLVDRLAGIEAELQDIAAEVRRAAEGSESDAQGAAASEERLSILYGLLHKYGGTEEEVLAHAEHAREDLDRLRGWDRERTAREASALHLRAAAEEAAATLSSARRAAADRLAGSVTPLLHELGFPEAAFDVTLTPVELGPSGIDDVAFQLAPNPGEPGRALARIASGGELSRVSLALKQVLAAADRTPTLVFDEIDAGIGGRSADPVGRSLWRLGRDHQVLCVTHLPQIAAHADHHLRIAKHAQAGRTVTQIEELDDEARLAELAAMLGGSGSAAAVATAEELLARARRDHSVTEAAR